MARAANLPAALTGSSAAVFARVSGATIIACGLGMLASAGVGALGDGRDELALLIPGLVALPLGLIVIRRAGPAPATPAIKATVGYATVTLAWVLATAIGAVPMLAAGVFSSPLDAAFETMSGFTTTGATLIGDIEAQSDAILIWRSITQWLGGVGIVVLIVAIAPFSAAGFHRVFYAEASGVGPDRLTPRIADTAKIVAGIYVALTAAAAIAYFAAGMSLYDAVNHAMTTLATGGFSTRGSSLAAFDSLAVELVAIVFMAAAGVNFAFYWRTIRGDPLSFQVSEVRGYFAILAGATLFVAGALVLADDVADPLEGLRQAAFTVTSLLTTTGFTTADFDAWDGFARFSILILMVIGGCAGSTAGGIKVVRTILLAKSASDEIYKQSNPSEVRVLRLGGRVFSEEARRAVLGFFMVYVLIFVAGVLGFTASGIGTESAISGVAATLNDVGPGLGDLGALESFEALPAGGRVVAIALMLIGRLEIFTVIALMAALLGGLRRLRLR